MSDLRFVRGQPEHEIRRRYETEKTSRLARAICGLRFKARAQFPNAQGVATAR